MEKELKRCDACGRLQDSLGFKTMGGIETCTACQIDMEINLNQLMEVVEKQLHRKKTKEAA